MADQWVILELSSKAEGEDPDLLRKSISYALRGADVFIPAAITQVGEDRVIHYLVEGYAFVRHKHADSVYSRLENSRYVQSVLTTTTKVNGGRSQKQLAFITDADIEKMKRQIHVETDQGIGVGDMVLITSGPYRQITAKVIEEIPEEDKVQVYIQLRSKESIITLPRSFLRLVTRASRPEFLDRFEATKAWFNDSIAAYRQHLWTPATDPMRESLQRFESLHGWSTVVGPLAGFVKAFYTPLDTSSLAERSSVVGRLSAWAMRWQTLTPTVRSLSYTQRSTQELRQRYEELSWLNQMQQRLDAIRADVLKIERKMTGNTSGYDNVVIDGLNLAMRVFYAPGMADLRDTKNRPSGVIYGFLRSISALAKRFPGAKLTVCWDGSNQVRKGMYDGYKANRNPSPLGPGGWDQIAWIKETLPTLGVAQAFNAGEEADDVIASLVRGPLKGHRNLILSSDQDLLQLLSETDFLMTPAQGKRKETIYDKSLLTQEWGVGPEKIVALRALLGDTSDNIPGVPTVPGKVLTELLQLYGSIHGIYASNLAGLTKLRYERLRAAERQVRLNETIMTLRTVPYEEVPPKRDQVIASERLTDVDVEVEPMVRVFFGENAAAGS